MSPPASTKDEFIITTNKDGSYKRKDAHFVDTVEKGGKFEPEAGRYHLYIARACPWANGTYTALKFKGLDHAISVSATHPVMRKTRPDDDNDKHIGWQFKAPGDAPVPNPNGVGAHECDDACVPDTVNGFATIRDLYDLAGAPPDAVRSTPVLWDKKTKTIVNNESTHILRIFNNQFNDIATHPERTLYSTDDAVAQQLVDYHEFIYHGLLNGVYKSGFAQSQGAYDTAVTGVFDTLDRVEAILGKQRYLGGDFVSWVDLRLFHNLVRFDPVYHTYFKCNIKRLEFEYPNLLGFIRDVYQTMPGAGDSINMTHIKMHYYTSHTNLSKLGIIPKGQGPDLTVAHGRDRKY